MELYHHNKAMYLSLVEKVAYEINDDCAKLTSDFFYKITQNLNDEIDRRNSSNILYSEGIHLPVRVSKTDKNFTIHWNQLQILVTFNKEITDKYANVFANTFDFLKKSFQSTVILHIFIHKLKESPKYFIHAYHQHAIIGKGSYSTVYQGFYTDSDGLFGLTAIKSMNFFKNKLDILAESKILNTFAESLCEKYICLVDEFCYTPADELFNLFPLDANVPTTANTVAIFVCHYSPSPTIDNIKITTLDAMYNFPSICAGLIYVCVNYVNDLHQMNIAHRDIKPQNILVYENQTLYPKIIDFGASCELNTDNESSAIKSRCYANDNKGTLAYLFPSPVDVDKFDPTDLWMLWIISDLWALTIMSIKCVCDFKNTLLFIVANKIDQSIPSSINNEIAWIYNLKHVARIMKNSYQFINEFIAELKFKSNIWKDTDEKEFLFIIKQILVQFVVYCNNPTFTLGNCCHMQIKMLLLQLTKYIGDHAINQIAINQTDDSPLPTKSKAFVQPMSLTNVTPRIASFVPNAPSPHSDLPSPSATVGPQTLSTNVVINAPSEPINVQHRYSSGEEDDELNMTSSF